MTQSTAPATEKQLNYIKSLLNHYSLVESDGTNRYAHAIEGKHLTKHSASRIISWALDNIAFERNLIHGCATDSDAIDLDKEWDNICELINN